MSADVKGILHSEFCDKLHKYNGIKYFSSKMLSYGLQLQENDLKHLNAIFCILKTSLSSYYEGQEQEQKNKTRNR